MPSAILSLVLVFMIAVISIIFVWQLGTPIIDTAKSSSEYKDAETSIRFMDNYLRETAREGNGSIRKFSLSVPKGFEVKKGEEAIIYYGGTYSSLFDYNTRMKKENLVYLTGSDVDCYEAANGTELVMENSYVKFVFSKVPKSEPWSSVDTGRAIRRITRKPNTTITIVNSSVQIDGDSGTSYGTGYSELLSSGKGLPFCTVHFFVNSTASVRYDVYYRIYAAADFITMDVRNIR